ncbi:alpha/beta hydrolase fold domain-containing protein [Phthorimaea operculella]|nr:alpha/beta hydrolase fold domain-containing protein [Phthorimaea operculella]
MSKIVSIIWALVFLLLGVLVYNLQHVPEKPNLDFQRWWGKGERPKQEDTSVRPFRIDFNDSMIADLKERLRNRRPFTKPLEGIQSQYGMNTIYLEKNLKYWFEQYDFKKRAELLNKFPHFKTRIQGLDLHFIHVKPQVKNKKVLPLLMLHGWPSSSKEFVKVIPKLTTPRKEYDFVYEVVAVDLPGFGYSEGSTKPGLNTVQIGIIMKNLMKRLGFQKFYIQAGDWGSQCATQMSTMFQDDILGFHTNMPVSSMPKSTIKLLLGSLVPFLFKHAEKVYPLKESLSYLVRESGYFHLQATKPDTIGVALTDSPAGLAGYLMEKMGICSNRDQLDTPHGGLDNLDLDDVLDTVTIMWANNCVTTATRLYAEGLSPQWTEIGTLHNNRDQLDTPHGGLDNLDLDDVLDTITIMWANNCVTTATRLYAEGLSPQWTEIGILHK